MTLVKVDVDQSPQPARRFEVRVVPTCWCSTKGRSSPGRRARHRRTSWVRGSRNPSPAARPASARGTRTVPASLRRFVDGADWVLMAAAAEPSTPSQYPGWRRGQPPLNWTFREM
ncbi:hypothetical protein ACF1AY_35520 [Streptomyces sp. NPDC014776]|uniref:hypothetical protein n=1 Tax=unclassified Streptomyces TaxID=2593676 RepID=UPI0036FD2625